MFMLMIYLTRVLLYKRWCLGTDLTINTEDGLSSEKRNIQAGVGAE